MKRWPYHSHAELTAAGFRFDRTLRCRGPHCHSLIHWYATPRKRAMPVDANTFTPHFATCPDREIFRRLARRKAEQREVVVMPDTRQAQLFPEVSL